MLHFISYCDCNEANDIRPGMESPMAGSLSVKSSRGYVGKHMHLSGHRCCKTLRQSCHSPTRPCNPALGSSTTTMPSGTL